MHRTRAGLIVAILGTLAIWGCGQNSAEQAANAEREVKLAQLQEDVRTISKSRDQLNKDLSSAKTNISRLQEEIKQLHEAALVRDQQLSARIAERDAGIAQLDQMRNGLRSLLNQMEAAAPIIPKPVSQEIRPVSVIN